MKPWLHLISRMPVLPRPDGLDLRYSEWTEPPSFIKKFIKSLTWKDFVCYPDTNLLRDRIGKHHNVHRENVFLGPGSAECIGSVFNCFINGESVLVSSPCFPMYEVYAKQVGLHINYVLPESNYTYKVNNWQGCNLIVITRPSSPLGHCFSRRDIIDILKQNITKWVLVDEAYIDYASKQDDISDLIHDYKNLIISRSFSKSFGAAGIRVGYLLSYSENINTISRFRQMYEVSGPSMKYAMYLLDNYSEVKKYCSDIISERNKLAKFFNMAGYDVLSSQGNWIHVEQRDSLVDALRENNIHARCNVKLPHTDKKWIRLSICKKLTRTLKKII